MKGLKESTIRSAWRKCSLVLFNPDIVLNQINELEAEPRPRTPNTTPLVSSLLCRTPGTIPQFAKGTEFMLID